MRNLIIAGLMLALASPCLGQEARPANVQQSGDVDVAIKDIRRELSQMYQPGHLDLGDNYSIMASFRILPDGSIPRESIHIVHSSGNNMVDRKALHVLWALGSSRALGPLSSPSSKSIFELRADERAVKLSITSFAPTPEEAREKVTQLSFLLKTVAAQQKSKNPMFSELLSHPVLKADNKRIDIEMTLLSAPLPISAPLPRNVAECVWAFPATIGTCLPRYPMSEPSPSMNC